jgi:hypothetical protein
LERGGRYLGSEDTSGWRGGVVMLVVGIGLGVGNEQVCFVVSSTLYTDPAAVMLINMMVMGCVRCPGSHVVDVSVVTSC